MSVLEAIRAGVDHIKAVCPTAAVSVVISDVSGTGLKSTIDDQAELSVMGEVGVSVGLVRVSTADFDKPTRGQVIVVDGDNVFVTDCKTDLVEAHYLIAYSITNPFTVDL